MKRAEGSEYPYPKPKVHPPDLAAILERARTTRFFVPTVWRRATYRTQADK